MLASKCPGCGKVGPFEMKDVVPKGSNYKYTFIQCGLCGTVVGVIEADNVVAILEKLAEKLNVKF